MSVDDSYKKAILLATDGALNCYGGEINNTDDMGATLEAIAAVYALNLPVYVVGTRAARRGSREDRSGWRRGIR
jgi:hypothetical protein